jgi:hypothetical protein
MLCAMLAALRTAGGSAEPRRPIREGVRRDVCFPAFRYLLRHRLGAVAERKLGHRHILGDRIFGLGFMAYDMVAGLIGWPKLGGADLRPGSSSK